MSVVCVPTFDSWFVPTSLITHWSSANCQFSQLAVLRRALDMCEQGSDIPLPDLAVLLAVCKLIDFLALLPLENFHLYADVESTTASRAIREC